MPDDREYYYACFMPAYELVPASSVADAIAIIRQRYPQAHWGTTWQSGVAGESLPVWADAGTNLRYELGEREDERKPVAYLRRTWIWLDEPEVTQLSSSRRSRRSSAGRTEGPLIGRSEGADAPPSRGRRGPARNYSGVFHRSSLDPGRNWRHITTGARSEPVRNALGESVRRTLEHRTTAGGTWQFVVKMTQR